MRNAIGFIITWIVFFAIWLLMITDLSGRDWVIGAGATTLASLATMKTGLNMTVKFEPSIHDLAQAIHIPAAIVRGTVDVLHELFKQLLTRGGAQSSMAGVPFDMGGSDAKSAARRALAVTYTTITPNSIVLGWLKGKNSNDGYMIFHQLKPRPITPVMKALGARDH